MQMAPRGANLEVGDRIARCCRKWWMHYCTSLLGDLITIAKSGCLLLDLSAGPYL
jgi:hypothetical protein